SADIAAGEERAEDDHGDGGHVDAGDGDELFERDVHHAQACGHGLLVAIQQKDGREHEILTDGAEREEAGGHEHVAAHRQHEAAGTAQTSVSATLAASTTAELPSQTTNGTLGRIA